MKKYTMGILISTVLTTSCRKSEVQPMQDDSTIHLNKLKREIIYQKNKNSYGIFLDISANDSLNYDPLALSLILAEDQNSKANFEVFRNMVSIFNGNEFDIYGFGKLSEVNRNFAHYYLTQSAKANDIAAQESLEEIYRKGIGLKRNLKKADSIINILKKDDPNYIPMYELK